LCTADEGKRKAAIDRNAAYFKEMAELGVRVFFAVVIPDDPDRKGRENFDLAVRGFGPLAEVAENLGGMIVLEGWPGGPPYPNLCCNPETYRAMLEEVSSPGLGINFDPSHLVRMGIDECRFIDEFADRVGHVHGKDTETRTENVHDNGHDHASIFKDPIFCGEFTWRYTIPGHGRVRWSYCFDVLVRSSFQGAICVELEDANYNGTEKGEKAGLLAAQEYLTSV
jgi:sugar phosphate isomerase/epimerase